MSYYDGAYSVRIKECNVIFKPNCLDDAFKALCAINADDSIKHGRCFPESDVKPSTSKSLSSNPNKWFAYMAWNYDEICNDVFEILGKLRFKGITYDEKERRLSLSFDDYIGDEDKFFRALAPYIEDGSYIHWLGEDGEQVKWTFGDGKMYGSVL